MISRLVDSCANKCHLCPQSHFFVIQLDVSSFIRALYLLRLGHFPSLLTYNLATIHNTFRGTVPSNFSDLTSLQIIHLHANRFSGVVPLLDSSLFDDKSSFIADCGYPSLYEDTLTCANCTMCCKT